MYDIIAINHPIDSSRHMLINLSNCVLNIYSSSSIIFYSALLILSYHTMLIIGFDSNRDSRKVILLDDLTTTIITIKITEKTPKTNIITKSKQSSEKINPDCDQVIIIMPDVNNPNGVFIYPKR